MAEQLEQTSSYTLQNVGEDNAPISFYITYSSQFIRESDGDGSLIVYADHSGNPATYNDAYSLKYTDLYVGDEHIAGGFGFRNITERNYAYAAIFETLPWIFDEVTNGSTGGGSSSGSDSQQKDISIDPDYSYVTTDNGIYELQYDSITSTLKLDCNHKDRILSTLLKIGEREIADGIGSYAISKTETEYDLRSIEAAFSYSAGDEISKVFFTYAVVNKNDIQTTIYIANSLCGSRVEPYALGTETEALKSECIYSLEDPNIKPQSFESKWRIEFKDGFNSILKGKKFGDMARIYLNAIAGNKVVSKMVCTLNFVEPVYYCSSESIPDSWGCMSKKVCNEDETILTFDHSSNSNEHDYVLVDKNYEAKFLHIGTNLYVDWDKANFLFATNHKGYIAPNIYKGQIAWKLSLSLKQS